MVTVREPTPALYSQRTMISQLVLPAAEQFASAAESERLEPDPGYNALFDLALSSQRKGEYQKAITHYTKAIEIDSQLADAYINRGAAYEGTGDLDQALQDLKHGAGARTQIRGIQQSR